MLIHERIEIIDAGTLKIGRVARDQCQSVTKSGSRKEAIDNRELAGNGKSSP
jgi:hypothetical protein